MQLDLSGKVALVTGSSKGIGYAIAQALRAEGCRVALNARNQAELSAATAALTGSICVAGDVTQPVEARRIVAEVLSTFGRLDILVCNVGSSRSVQPGQESHDEWMRMLSLNLLSATNMVEVSKDALAISQGCIVCISSICGQEVIPGAPVTYSAAKAALNAYIRGVARPLGRQGVRINGVAPGNILFPGSVWERKRIEDAAAVEQMLKYEVPIGRLGIPQDVADLAIWLASPAAGFATGGIYHVDGGQTRS